MFESLIKFLASLSEHNRTGTHNHLFHKRTLNLLTELVKLLSCVLSNYLYDAFDCMFLSCKYAFQIESTIYICLNVKEHLGENWCDI